MSKGIHVINFSASTMHVLAKSQLEYKGGAAEVHLVAKVSGPTGAADGVVPEVAADDVSEPRFYLSPMIAQTAFEDITKGNKLMPVFTGRTASEMQEHLAKNAK